MGVIRRGVRKVWEWTRPVLVAVVLFLGVRTFLVDAFLIPTSLVRWAAVKEANPNKPREAINMARMEKMLKTEAVFSSLL